MKRGYLPIGTAGYYIKLLIVIQLINYIAPIYRRPSVKDVDNEGEFNWVEFSITEAANRISIIIIIRRAFY